MFTIGIGEFDGPGRTAALTSLADGHRRGFFPAPDAEDIANAYVTVGDLLNNEYLITIANGITDCAEHELEVTVEGADGDRDLHAPDLRHGAGRV